MTRRCQFGTALRTTCAFLFLSHGMIPGEAMAVERAVYEIQSQEKDFEVRLYPPRLVAETTVQAGFEDAGSEAFRRLFAYIQGANRSKESIAMTAPVTQQGLSEKIPMTAPVTQQAQGTGYRVAFVMPASYTPANLPVPTDPAVRIVQEPARRVAAIRYSGTWRESGYIEQEKRLRAWVKAKGLEPTGESPIWARYDPPFMPWFMRQNEVLIPIRGTKAGTH